MESGDGERDLLQKGREEFWVVMKLFYILLVVVIVQLHLSNLQNCTFKGVNFTVYKLYLKMGRKKSL